MLRSALRLRGYRVGAKDGEVGKVRDLFFDDNGWGVRYLVVDTRPWLGGRRVLLSPASLGRPHGEENVFRVQLTREEIETSPSVTTDQPVSRQLEKDIVDYFGWPVYWSPAAPAAGSMSRAHSPPHARQRPESEQTIPTPQELEGDPSVRSMYEVAGYRIRAEDGQIGHVEDFIVDDEAWAIRYLVVDTRNWLPGGKVILAPDWFGRFDWHESKAYTALSKAAVKEAPGYNPSQPVNRDYEGRLHDYYGRPAYWMMTAAPSLSWRM